MTYEINSKTGEIRSLGSLGFNNPIPPYNTSPTEFIIPPAKSLKDAKDSAKIYIMTPDQKKMLDHVQETLKEKDTQIANLLLQLKFYKDFYEESLKDEN